MSGWLTTDQKDLFFEDTSVGRLKKKMWEASDEEIDKILDDYGIPTPSQLTKPGTYVQTTIREKVVENRRKNDIVFVPIGCTELHGRHTVTALDTFMVTQILEGVRRCPAVCRRLRLGRRRPEHGLRLDRPDSGDRIAVLRYSGYRHRRRSRLSVRRTFA